MYYQWEYVHHRLNALHLVQSVLSRQVGTYKRRNYHVEVLQMSVLWVSEHGREDINQQFEVLCALSEVLSQVTDHRVKQSEKNRQESNIITGTDKGIYTHKPTNMHCIHMQALHYTKDMKLSTQ